MRRVKIKYRNQKSLQIAFLLAAGTFLVMGSCKNSNKKDKEILTDSSILMDETNFIKDSIWFKAYSYYNSEILRPEIITVLQKVSREENIEILKLGFFNMLIQNYDCKSLKVIDFLIKYSFANPEFIEGNLDELLQIGLFNKAGKTYRLTEKGNSFVNQLKLEFENFIVSINDSTVNIFRTISKNASKSDFKGVSKSLKNRISASLRFENSDNTFAQFMTAFDDIVAIRNDQSHCRYQFISNTESNMTKKLSRQEIEVLGSSSYYGDFKTDRFQQRSTCGYTEKEPQNFTNEHVSKKLLQKNDSIYHLTGLGKRLETTTSLEMENRFYQPWTFMTNKEYLNI